MKFKILKTLLVGSLSFIIAASSMDGYGKVSNAYTDSKLEEHNIETETKTSTEIILKERGINDIPTQEETESNVSETIIEITEPINTIEEQVQKNVDTPIENKQQIEQSNEQNEQTEQTEQIGNKVSLGTYKLTAYCACSKCCGKWAGGNTSSGTFPTQGRTVACNTLAAGTRVNINGHDYIVEDTGNMKGNVIDIFFNSHQEALNFGVQYAEVFVYNN